MPPQWKILRDWTRSATRKSDLYVYDLVTQFITPLNTASHCADFEHYAVSDYAYSLTFVF